MDYIGTGVRIMDYIGTGVGIMDYIGTGVRMFKSKRNQSRK